MTTTAVVYGPALSDVAAAVDSGENLARVRAPDEAAGERGAALRRMLQQGAGAVLLVDAATPLRPDWLAAGAGFACVSDHLNLTGDNPLVGPNDERWGPRFPDMTDAWDPGLRRTLRRAAVRLGVELFEGVLAGVTVAGPSAAELSMYRLLGADMMGTGFVHEAIVARHAGRPVAGLARLGPDAGLPGEAEEAVALVEAALAVMAEPADPGLAARE